MKALICIFFLSLAYSGFAQKGQHIQYSGSSNLPGASDAVIVDDVPLVHTTQFLPLNNSGNIVGLGDINAQINQVFLNISSALKQAGSKPDQIVKLNIYIRNSSLISAVQEQIEQLEEQARLAVLEAGETVKGGALQAVWVRGRVTWDTKKLDGLTILLPELNQARKVGEPTVTIRKIG